MKTGEYTCWKDGDFYVGYLNDSPEYQTQGMSKEELLDNLKDLLQDIEMKDEYDFTNAEQGKFYRPLEELEILQGKPAEEELIDFLLKKPLKVLEFKPLSREEFPLALTWE